MARLVASVDKYIYTVNGDTILSHQFISNNAQFGNGIEVSQDNHFPWSGEIHYEINNPNQLAFKLGIRIPSWSRNKFGLKINGKKIDLASEDGFIYINVNDESLTVDLSLDMNTKFMRSSNKVSSNYGKIAVQRGPIVYAAEETDNKAPLWNYKVETDKEPKYHYNKDLLEGVGTITVKSIAEEISPEDGPLYSTIDEATANYETDLKLIPYYAWANREEGQMQVWLNK